jgi:hypothetical protein
MNLALKRGKNLGSLRRVGLTSSRGQSFPSKRSPRDGFFATIKALDLVRQRSVVWYAPQIRRFGRGYTVGTSPGEVLRAVSSSGEHFEDSFSLTSHSRTCKYTGQGRQSRPTSRREVLPSGAGTLLHCVALAPQVVRWGLAPLDSLGSPRQSVLRGLA